MEISFMKYKVISGPGVREDNLDYHTSYTSESVQYFMVVDGYLSKKEDIVNYSNNLMIKVINNKKEAVEILEETPPEEINMSLTLIKLEGYSMTVYHAGDCRVYMNDILITEDETFSWEKLLNRGKDKSEISLLSCEHPSRNILTNSIKSSNIKQKISVKKLKIIKNSTIILCTDGFWSVHHTHIIKGNMIKEAHHEYEDNYTAIIINP